MSHIAESFALQVGVPLNSPEIQENFFPLDHPLNKVILINNFAGDVRVNNGQAFAAFPSKIYDYFDEVVQMVEPVLSEMGYKFYQIGTTGKVS